MRKIGSSGVTTGVSGTKEELDRRGATVAGDPGARPTGESFPNLSDRGMSRRQSWLICMKRGYVDFIHEDALYVTQSNLV